MKPGRVWLRFSTFATLSACFFVVLSFFVFSYNMQNLLTMWGDDIQLTAYLKADTTPEQIRELVRDVSSDARAGHVEWVDQKKALRDFQVQLASYAPDLAQDQEILSLVPQSLQIQVKESHQSKSEVEAFAKDVGQLKGVEEVRFGQEWIKKYAAFVTALRKIFVMCVLIILAAAFFVVGNAVRASIEVRRREIEVLELVGASPSMIRKPFLIEGAVLSTASMALALAISFAAYKGVTHFLTAELDSPLLASSLTFPGFFPVAGVLLTSAVIGLAAAYVCIRKINTGFAASGAR